MLTLIQRTFLTQQKRPKSWQNCKQKDGKGGMTLESSDPPEVTAPPEGGEGCPLLNGLLLTLREWTMLSWQLPCRYYVCFLDRNCSQSWEDGGSGITTRGFWCQVVCGPWADSPCRRRGLDSATVLCWASPSSWKTKESVCAILTTCLQLSTPLLENNMLCPKYVYRHKVLMESLHWRLQCLEKRYGNDYN